MRYRVIVALFRRSHYAGTIVRPLPPEFSGNDMIPGGYRLGGYYAPDGFSYGRTPPE